MPLGDPDPRRCPLAQAQNPPPVAEPTASRQDPKEEPGALTLTPGSARGVPGNLHSYRDMNVLSL